MREKVTPVGRPGIDLIVKAVEHLPDIVEICDERGRFLYVNKAFERLTGWTLDEVIGQTPAALLRSGAHTDAYYEEMERTVLAGKIWSGRIISRTKSDDLMLQDLVLSPLTEDGRVTGIVALKRDITAKEPLDSQLLQADRMAAVGQLASGVAHEINNPLSYVLGNLAFLSEEIAELRSVLPAGKVEELESALADIRHGAIRVRDIVQDLGALSKSRGTDIGPVDVRHIIDSAIKLLSNEVKHRARLVRDYRKVPLTWANESELGQVFLNLLLNATEAVPVGAAGDNEIRITARTGDQGECVVEISDTGEGISDNVVSRIFDPFFTTKPVGKGTGLGLSIVHNIVTGLGGWVTVRSRVGEGTSFVVSLPPGDDKVAAMAEDEPGTEWQSQVARILVIDDEHGVLRAVKRILKGHKLTVCLSGLEALEHLKEGEFDLVFCDLMMPELTGMDVFDLAVEMRPEMKDRFVFITGGAFTERAREFLERVTCPVVQKPFDADDMRGLIKRLVSS